MIDIYLTALAGAIKKILFNFKQFIDILTKLVAKKFN